MGFKMHEPTFRYINRAEICRLRGVGRTTQYLDEKNGRFPTGERHGYRTVLWRSDIVAKWMDAQSQTCATAAPASSADAQSRAAHESAKVRSRKKTLTPAALDLAGQA